jgi:hypothetical protein
MLCGNLQDGDLALFRSLRVIQIQSSSNFPAESGIRNISQVSSGFGFAHTELIAKQLCEKYAVNEIVIAYRLDREELWPSS